MRWVGRPGDRGAVLPLAGISLIALIAFAALALDIGYERLVRRDLQAVADVMSLDLVRRLDGSTRQEFVTAGTTQYIAFEEAKHDSAARNDFVESTTRTITIRLGTVDPGTHEFSEVVLAGVPTAVEVTLRDTDVERWFSSGSGETSRTAVSELEPQANFMIGSYLAAADPDFDTGLLNRLLPRFIGSSLDSLNITAVSWQGLADSSMDLGRLSTELGLGSPDELAEVGVFNARDVYVAAAQVMQDDGNTAAAQIFDVFATEADSSAVIDFGNVFAHQGGSDGAIAAGANPSIPGLFFLNTTVFAINGTNLVSIPSFDLGIPGLTNNTMTVEVIEAPQLCAPTGSFCHVGDSVHTAQVQIRLENTLDINLNAVLAGARLTGTLTTETEAAGATGTLSAAYCAGNASGRVPGIDVGVTTNPITTTASEDLTLEAKVLFLVTDVAELTVNGAVALASGSGGSASFAHPAGFLPDIGTGTMQRVGSPDLGLASALSATGSNVSVLGLPGIPLGTLVSTINVGLSPVLTSINNFVVRRLSRTLGLDLGGGDVGAIDLACESPALVG